MPGYNPGIQNPSWFHYSCTRCSVFELDAEIENRWHWIQAVIMSEEVPWAKGMTYLRQSNSSFSEPFHSRLVIYPPNHSPRMLCHLCPNIIHIESLPWFISPKFMPEFLDFSRLSMTSASISRGSILIYAYFFTLSSGKQGSWKIWRYWGMGSFVKQLTSAVRRLIRLTIVDSRYTVNHISIENEYNNNKANMILNPILYISVLLRSFLDIFCGRWSAEWGHC